VADPKRAPHRVSKARELRLLGKFPDREVAERLGTKLYVVACHRLKLRIPAWRRLPEFRPWTPPEEAILGTVPDREAARRLNRTLDAVVLHRRKLGRTAQTARNLWTPQKLSLLGTMPDESVAVRTGFSSDSVRRKRHALHIRLNGTVQNRINTL
jgi:hypothetical protein